jgi:hypothetical protein
MIVEVKIEGCPEMPTHLEQLIAAARGKKSSPAEREAQRRSFAYGNTNIENPRITRETVDQQAEALKAEAAKR